MATTKVRAKTPMKNKMKFWRKMSIKTYDGVTEHRSGRQLRNMMQRISRNAYALPIHIWLLKCGGIATPNFDKHQNKVHTDSMGQENITDIEDAVIISESDVKSDEGTINASTV